MNPTLIAAGGNLLGGLLGRGKKVRAQDNSYGHVKGIMKAAKEFGFNPLTLLGSVSAVGGAAADNSSLGQGIANAALIASDAISAKRATAKRLNDYQTQNQRLQSRLDAITIRPPVPGVYGRARLPSDPEVYGDDRGNPLHDPVKLDRGAGGGIAVPDPRLDRGSGGYGHGFRLEPAPGYSPASVIEEEYGDVASWGYGLVKVGADVGYNARRFTDYMGWTTPGTVAGAQMLKTLFGNGGRKDRVRLNPDGYTEDGKPFWVQPDGSVRWDYSK